MHSKLLVAGFSARSLAQSVKRAGYVCCAVDCFGDQDLRECCDEVHVLRDYPHELPRLLSVYDRQIPFIFGGALENYPDILSTIGSHRPVWGMPREVVCKVRNPISLQSALARAGFPSLRTWMSLEGASIGSEGSKRRWLLKPLASGGGLQIRFRDTFAVPPGFYCQEFRQGELFSALLLAYEHTTRLIGITQQLTGIEWLHAAPFAYIGNIGPLSLSEKDKELLENLGTCLARAFALQGLFGIDYVHDDEGVFVLEVNPRYTASVELYELASGSALLPFHIGAFHSNAAPGLPETVSTPTISLGKAIYYAPRNLVWREEHLRELRCRKVSSSYCIPQIADIPMPNSMVEQGQPVLTLFAAGDSPRACRVKLEKQASHLDTVLAGV